MLFERLAEDKVKEAIENGEFDNLSGKGKPIDLTEYFQTPADLRLGYSVLKSAGCVPEEVALQKEIEDLKAELAQCLIERKRHLLVREIENKELKFHLLMDSSRRSRGKKRE